MSMDIPLTERRPFKVGAYVDCVRRDALFHAFVAAYVLVGFTVGIAAGVPHKFVPLTYATMVVTGLSSPIALVLAGIAVWSLRSPAPLRAFGANLEKVLMGAHTVAGLMLFGSLLIFMGVFTSLKTMLTDIVPFFADPYLADLDKALHGRDPWLYATTLLPAKLTPALEVLYFGAWGLLLSGSLLAVLLVPKLQEVRSHYVWASLIVWPVLGNVIACATMSAGPVFYPRVAGGERFDDLIAYLAQNSVAHEWARAYLWKFYVSGEAGAGAAISAFPSLHVANATLLVLLASRVHRWLKWAALAYCAVILFGSVYLGWHYAVDGYFSIAATVLIWKVVGWALRASARPRAGAG